MTQTAAKADEFICSVLRDEYPPWPESAGADFAETLAQRSLEHGVQGLLISKTRESTRWTEWPEVVRENLYQGARLAIAFELQRLQKATSFLRTLKQRGIDVLVLKGAALAQTLYAGSGLRSHSDIDLFIRFTDIELVRTLLLEQQHEVVPPIFKSHQFKGILGYACGWPITLDIHWRISNTARYARSISFDDAWSRSVALPGDSGARALGPTDALLLACIHRSSSSAPLRGRLIWIYDIHLMVSEMSPLQLTDVVNEALQRNVHSACADGLTASQARFATEIPVGLIEKLQVRDPVSSLSKRYSESNLALLIDDMRRLRSLGSRWELIRELVFADPVLLLSKYGKKSKVWLPLLYLRQICVGVVNRLSLR